MNDDLYAYVWKRLWRSKPHYRWMSCLGKWIFVGLILTGCATTPQKPLIQYKTVSVPVYTRIPIPIEYTQDRIVVEPVPSCRLLTTAVFCQDQAAELVDSYRSALRQSNLDKQALRSLDKDTP